MIKISAFRNLPFRCTGSLAVVITSGLLMGHLSALQAKEIFPIDQHSLSQASHDSPKEVIDQVWQIIQRDFLDVNEAYSAQQWLNKRAKILASTYGSPAEAYEAIRRMLSTLNDPRTTFYTPSEFAQLSSEKTSEGGTPAPADRGSDDLSFSLVKADDGTQIGYIRISAFAGASVLAMKNAVAQLEAIPVQGYILDLRDNPGGIFQESIQIARQLIPKGVIVSTDSRRTGKRKELADGTALTIKPLVVLVNQNTASAAEILAGALQFNQRAVVVGSRTAGQVHTIQSVRRLSDGSGIRVTVAVYTIPGERTGQSVHSVIPNVEVNGSSSPTRAGRSTDEPLADNQYKEAKRVLSNLIRAKAEP